ncbi:peptidoglycan DD-metalloendopeptidase family protein [Pasteurella atlantica]|uniref:Peptidoglycan DD-metalloendopeptidase family protein n=2 Tax=Pasteurellales TaxID=135625 RepID=A0AAW8CEF5_9PAST|nr:peptidoglycan DD-metalloendopeptidase family protein [Pasteurella atlantica]MBR0573267.1 peptidoglycan DD-metalloendopeptidase family protein [Pasteurella atlantica]MDP8039117.1 peptidoglycan DD-metalloendopeptidase family protein [Pasteurella atlantica]MDP8043421.1 peptidoglycan DD-metalloendopeptidase family protein [Pasteurella atlantica]MDP8045507.1 peptidoglycan DD-metalloendopeptidase family protein [Pasteurella atlantica]MDP8061283.1 peptidoglycan DD-metalloendopeptidase family prote
MKYIILAAERKKRKQRKRWMIFFAVFFLLSLSIFFAFKKQDQDIVIQEQAIISSDDIFVNESLIDQVIDISDELVKATIPISEDLVGKDVVTEGVNSPLENNSYPEEFDYTLKVNETLNDVFEQFGLDQSISKDLIKKYPKLSHLKSKQQIYLVVENNQLKHLSWFVSEKEEHIFDREKNGDYSYKEILKKGVWKKELLKGEIEGNLSVSLQKIGISLRQISQIATGLKPQLSLKRLRKGDEFVVLANCEYVDNKRITIGDIEGFRLTRGKEDYYAIKATNGRYYGENGAAQHRTKFSRYPLRFKPRITSKFNPYRRHPITRRIRPHKGVDFGVKTGTLVIAPADGIVTTVAYQRQGAGKYIKIQHNKKYATVYMHLSRQLVKRGQRVKKGQRIGYSGNTGRSTGPHLHYEFHINGRAVNPMTVRLPGVNANSTMSNKERKIFLAKAKSIIKKLK